MSPRAGPGHPRVRATDQGLPDASECEPHRRRDPEWEIWPEHCREGSWGWRIVAELAPRAGDTVLRKVRYGAFYGTPLDHLLRLWGVDTLVICGAGANRQARRALEAAATKELAGDHQSALALLAMAAAGPLGEVDDAMVERLRGQILLDRRHAAEALPLLTGAARRLEPFDPRLARDTHFEALRAAVIAGRLAPSPLEAAAAARAAPQPQAARARSTSSPTGWRTGSRTGTPPARRRSSAPSPRCARRARARRRACAGRGTPGASLRTSSPRTRGATSPCAASSSPRESGALAVLPVALHNLARLRCLEGDLAAAAAVLDEADAIVALTGIEPMPYGRLTLAGFRGDESEAVALFDATDPLAAARAEGNVLTFTEHARAVLYKDSAGTRPRSARRERGRPRRAVGVGVVAPGGRRGGDALWSDGRGGRRARAADGARTWPATACRTRRSAPSSSSARARSSTTCTRSSPSSGSPAAGSWTSVLPRD